jgi:uncharacterized protein YqhQ
MSTSETRKQLHVGGQAVIEGVMMRSPTCIATAVRIPGGKIVIKSEPFVSLTKRFRILNLPIIRGAIALIETFVIAVKALSFSVDQAEAESDEKPESGRETAHSNVRMGVTITAALLVGLAIFFYIPLLLTDWLGFRSGFMFNLVDGFFRLLFIFLYIFLITRWKEMQRVFEYHGAEHKTIFAFEETGEMDPGTIKRYPKAHPRCSTSFLLIVVIVSVLVFLLLGRPSSITDRLVRFLFIPVIGGVSYEMLKLSAKPSVKKYLGFLIQPGLFLQRFTTREPSPDQLEVAIAALNACLDDKLLES